MDKEQWNQFTKDLDEVKTSWHNAFPEQRREGGLWWVLWEFAGWAYLAKNGADLRGFSLSHRYDEWLMVVKATIDDLPVVAFMSGSTTSSCVRKVIQRLDEGSLRFVPDKFA